ncbi:hypothetical protein N9422_02705 [Candidatus Pelagibacter sp.]|nr:hypothetical protein [Candidatus Pelagibacter sp.]
MKIHHIGIFVKKISNFEKYFNKKILITYSSRITLDKKLGVKIKFIKFKGSNQLFEIIEPYGKKNPVTPILKTGNNIINHLAFMSNNFKDDIDDLVAKNCYPISKIVKSKFFKSNIVFLMSPFKFIIEVIDGNKN